MERIIALDIIRGIAVLMVLINHHEINRTFEVMNFGHGVDIFFVLSGYLIGKTTIEKRNTFVSFVTKRSLRIYPLYYLTLIVLFFTLADGSALHLNTKHYLLFLGNLISTPTLSLFVLWSLAVEEHFYILFSIVLFFNNFNIVKRITLFSFFLLLLPNIFRFYFSFADIQGNAFLEFLYSEAYNGTVLYDEGLRSFFLNFNTLCRIDMMGFGLLLSVRKLPFLSLLGRIPTSLLFLSLTLVGPIIKIIPIYLSYILSALIICYVISLSLQRSRSIKPNFVLKVLSNFGYYSYGLYLLHPIVLNYIPSVESIWGTFFSFLAFLSISFVISFLVYHLVEKHFLNLGRLLLRRPKRICVLR